MGAFSFSVKSKSAQFQYFPKIFLRSANSRLRDIQLERKSFFIDTRSVEMKLLKFVDNLSFLHYIYILIGLVMLSLLTFITKAPLFLVFFVYIVILAILIHLVVLLRSEKEDEL